MYALILMVCCLFGERETFKKLSIYQNKEIYATAEITDINEDNGIDLIGGVPIQISPKSGWVDILDQDGKITGRIPVPGGMMSPGFVTTRALIPIDFDGDLRQDLLYIGGFGKIRKIMNTGDSNSRFIVDNNTLSLYNPYNLNQFIIDDYFKIDLNDDGKEEILFSYLERAFLGSNYFPLFGITDSKEGLSLLKIGEAPGVRPSLAKEKGLWYIAAINPTNKTQYSLAVQRQKGSFRFVEGLYRLDRAVNCVLIKDLNLDGNIDLIIIDGTQLSVRFGSGGGNFGGKETVLIDTKATAPDVWNIYDVVLDNFDNDEDLEIVLYEVYSQKTYASYYEQTKNGFILKHKWELPDLRLLSEEYDRPGFVLKSGDFNKDGSIDFAIGPFNVGLGIECKVFVFLNTAKYQAPKFIGKGYPENDPLQIALLGDVTKEILISVRNIPPKHITLLHFAVRYTPFNNIFNLGVIPVNSREMIKVAEDRAELRWKVIPGALGYRGHWQAISTDGKEIKVSPVLSADFGS